MAMILLPLHFVLNTDRSTSKLNTMPRQIDAPINIQSCRSGIVRNVSTTVMFLKKSHGTRSPPSPVLVSLPFARLLFTCRTTAVVTGPVQSVRSTLYVRNSKCSRRCAISPTGTYTPHSWLLTVQGKFTRKIQK